MEIHRTKARYAILGAIIGDSLGSTLEFESGTNAKLLISKYSKFENGLVGAGPFQLVPGQFTDDTEMALAIMSVIMKQGSYDQKYVSRMYHAWYNSNPFDMGKTTRTSVSQPSLTGMLHATKKYNSGSLSNGFLMRLFGLVALYYQKTQNEMIDAVCEDVKLTHSNSEALHIASIYAIMLWKAIHGENANKIYWWGKNHCGSSSLIVAIYHAVDNNSNSFFYHDEEYNIKQIDSHIFGFVGFAFWLLLRSIKYHNSYQNAILDVVSYGGDTDTNACIVGAVMGALYPETVPAKWIGSVLNCTATDRYKNYPIANPLIWKKWLP